MHAKPILLAPLLLTLAATAHADQIQLTVPSQILAKLHVYNTPHYTMYTDLPEADAREADLRMTRMFEEYQRRTAGFAGQVTYKFPFLLFQQPDDYHAAGAPAESAGVYIHAGPYSRLMAIAGEHTDRETWHVVQHEGFHQFAVNTIRGEMPIWVNEGLAEYFGEALWTGDSFITGIIPKERLKEVNVAILRKTFKPFDEIMTMSQEEWGSHLDYNNYTQAWAMVQFLAHGENGRYQGAFVHFMQNLNRRMPATQAWTSVFGADSHAFQERCTQWWLSLPKDSSHNLYMQVAISTLTSFLARATMQKQHFTDFSDFLNNIKLPDLTADRDLWLPPKLFQTNVDFAKKNGTWTLETPKGATPRLTCTDTDGTTYTSFFTLTGRRVQVTVRETPPKAAANPY